MAASLSLDVLSGINSEKTISVYIPSRPEEFENAYKLHPAVFQQGFTVNRISIEHPSTTLVIPEVENYVVQHGLHQRPAEWIVEKEYILTSIVADIPQVASELSETTTSVGR
jgi:hypothetical protein